MERKVFILLFCLSWFAVMKLSAQLNTTTGIPWGTISPAEPLVLNEKFQGFAQFHSDPNPNAGNSDNKSDAGGNVIYGYKNDTVAVPVIGSTKGKIYYYYYQCAFAPKWKTAYAYRDSLAGTGTPENTPNVSNGFVEISRTFAASGDNLPTVHGFFIVDLREIEFVETIQWSHSSTGGNKRGVLCEFSLDDGKSWDTLRYQPGTNYTGSFTKDVTSGVKTTNGFRCDPSAYGMTWEDGIFTGNVMLRFGEAGGQTPRIHDLKVYGTYNPLTNVRKTDRNELEIYASGKKIRISEPCNIEIYTITGSLVVKAQKKNLVSLDGYPGGIYLVKAQAGYKTNTVKVLVK